MSWKPSEERFSKRWEWKNMTNDAKVLSKMRIEIGP